MNKILCAGESIIDFISLENGKNLKETEMFSKQAGGSSSNVAVGLSRLDIPASFTGIIGGDYFGGFLESKLLDCGIDCSLLKKTPKYNTPIVFVGLDEKGGNEFCFYRDFNLNKEYKILKQDYQSIKECGILHFSSVVLRENNFRIQILKLIDYVKTKNRGIIHFDANIRFGLWNNRVSLKNVIVQYCKMSDIIKFSEEELYFVSGIKNIEKSLRNMKLFKNKLVIVTAAEKGSYTLFNGEFIKVPAFKIDAVDATGAGDAFVAAFLSRIYRFNHKEFEKLKSRLTPDIIKEWLIFSNAAGAMNCVRRGATSGMTSEKKINDFIKGRESNEKN
ncbi:MAG TPA: carbohydrate kinase [bacterium]|nr:carbohydrate kinase [bacterium]HPN31907.1 carbohydrate kinase [bacterium]